MTPAAVLASLKLVPLENTRSMKMTTGLLIPAISFFKADNSVEVLLSLFLNTKTS